MWVEVVDLCARKSEFEGFLHGANTVLSICVPEGRFKITSTVSELSSTATTEQVVYFVKENETERKQIVANGGTVEVGLAECVSFV